jgi:hypothetical protein
VPRFINEEHDLVSGFGNDLSVMGDQASERKLTSRRTDS